MNQAIEVLAPDQDGLGESFFVAELLAANGAQVEIGQVIAVIESALVTIELEVFDTGILEWAVAQGDTVRAGQLIGNVTIDDPPGRCVVLVELDAVQTLALDQARGMISRRDYLVSRIPKANG
jgi:pyruvate/2-oxoglutarate dehydrogenase complex dihydrolipoamide acyltransferase (E2) component